MFDGNRVTAHTRSRYPIFQSPITWIARSPLVTAVSKAAYKAVKDRMPALGRSPDALTMLPGVMPVVGRTDKEAREKLAVLQSFVDSTNGLQLLTDRLGFDMTPYDFDGPVPELPQTEFSQTFARVLLAKARAEGTTLRDLLGLERQEPKR